MGAKKKQHERLKLTEIWRSNASTGAKARQTLKCLFGRHASIPVKIARTSLILLPLGFASMPFVAASAPGRPLTANEVDILDNTYGNAVDYDKIRIHTSPLADAYLKLVGAEAATFRNTIWVRSENAAPLSGDDSLASYIYTHEVGHVWQHQSGQSVSFVGPLENLRNMIWQDEKTDQYFYTLEEGKALTDYGIEQQASILADYFAICQGDVPVFLDHDMLGKTDGLKEKYEAVIGATLGIPLPDTMPVAPAVYARGNRTAPAAPAGPS